MAHDPSSPGDAVHPLLLITVGPGPMEIGLRACARRGPAEDVPMNWVALGTGPHDERAAESLPLHRYLQLESPFQDEQDFAGSHLQDWLCVLHDPALRRLALSHSVDGVPAVAAAACLHRSSTLRRMVREACPKRPEKVVVQVSFADAIGCGAALVVCAVVQQAFPKTPLHLVAAMPDLFGGDEQDGARALAALRHVKEARVRGPAMDQHVRFESVRPVFAQGSRTAIDWLEQEVESVLTQLRSSTGRALEPRGFCSQTTASVRRAHPRSRRYLAVAGARIAVSALRRQCPAAESPQHVDAVVDAVGLSPEDLLARLAPGPDPRLLDYRAVTDASARWEKGARALQQRLPIEIIAAVDRLLGPASASFGSCLRGVRSLLVQRAREFDERAAGHRKDRMLHGRRAALAQARLGSATPQEMHVLTEELADGWSASLRARAEQERCQHLAGVLAGALPTMPSVVQRLGELELRAEAQRRLMLTQVHAWLNARQEALERDLSAAGSAHECVLEVLDLDELRRRAGALAPRLQSSCAWRRLLKRAANGTLEMDRALVELETLVPPDEDLAASDVQDWIDRLVAEEGRVVLELPGGPGGILGRSLSLPEGTVIVTGPWVRVWRIASEVSLDGPALSLLREQHDRYLARPGTISPYCTERWPVLPELAG
jgi:hypothetical protein